MATDKPEGYDGWGAALVRFQGREHDDDAVLPQECTVRVCVDEANDYEASVEGALASAGWLRVRDVRVVAFVADGWMCELTEAVTGQKRQLP